MVHNVKLLVENVLKEEKFVEKLQENVENGWQKNQEEVSVKLKNVVVMQKDVLMEFVLKKLLNAIQKENVL